MSRVESLESIETSLRDCRDLSSSIGESMLTYMIDMAIVYAREYAARERQLSEVHSARPSARIATVAHIKTIKVG